MSAKLLRSFIQESLRHTINEEEEVGRPREDPNDAFARWLDAHEDGTEEAAKELNISVSHANKLARGDAKPSLELAAKIEKDTSGNVPLDYWIKS